MPGSGTGASADIPGRCQPAGRSPFAALDAHPHAVRSAERRGLLHLHTHPVNGELVKQKLRDVLGQGFHQLELALDGEGGHTAGSGGVVHGVGDVVVPRCHAGIRRHREADAHRLGVGPFLGVDAQDGVDGETADEYGIQINLQER